MKAKEKKIECFRCGKKVPESKLNQTDLCPECAGEETEMLETDRKELNPEDD